MGREKDQIWEHAEDLNGRFKCNYCGGVFSGGAPRLKSHLSGIKRRDIRICTKVPENVQAAAFLAIDGSSKKMKTETTPNDQKEIGRISAYSNDQAREKDKSLVDKKLAQFIISNNIASDVIGSASFIDFLREAVEFGRDYEPPSNSTFKTKDIPGFALEVEEYVKRVKKSWGLTGCTLMLDVCCNTKKQDIMSVVAYSPTGAVFMNSFEIPKSGSILISINAAVSSIIEDSGTDHVVQLITSKATVLDSVRNVLKCKYPQIYMTECVACHILSVLKNIQNKVDWVKETVKDAKLMIDCVNENPVILALIRERTNIIEWGSSPSSYEILQSIFNNENELLQLVASNEWRLLDDSGKAVAKKITDIISNTKFWSQGQDLLLVLKPFVRMLCLVNGEGSTSGYLYEALKRAEVTLKQCCSNDALRYEQMLKLFEERRNKYIIHPIHAAAAFLNPAYMCSENFEENQEMKQGIDFILENLVANEEKDIFIREVILYRNRRSNLFTNTAMRMLKTHHPRVWWDYCGGCLPVLRKYAVRVLSQPCSSSCEQRWNAFEVAQTRMNRQADEMLENFVWVRMNTLIMEKFKTLEERCFEAIDLEKCDGFPCSDGLLPLAELFNEDLDNNEMDEASTSRLNRQPQIMPLNSDQITQEKMKSPRSADLSIFSVPNLPQVVPLNPNKVAQAKMKSPSSADLSIFSEPNLPQVVPLNHNQAAQEKMKSPSSADLSIFSEPNLLGQQIHDTANVGSRQQEAAESNINSGSTLGLRLPRLGESDSSSGSSSGSWISVWFGNYHPS